MHAVFVVLIFVDQVTKVLFSSRDFFFSSGNFKLVKNFALPFGLDFGTMANVVVLFIVYVVAGWFIYRMNSTSKIVTTGKVLFLSGAASNLADRLIYGYVRDFIDLDLGFVFNLADVFIVLGLAIILLFPTQSKDKVENHGATGEY
ncbi:MAG: signal peptidase II [Candidatus Doudnabacteria bacterium]|nr:signal peptidase II [Candidatus Doudnabacteria bacterium]